ncbi:MAG: methyltransferase [Rhizobiales bacterium]|nr:methyltransferase [Hyphomicrobiales bacterium]
MGGTDGGRETLDAFFGGRLALRQPARGHRSGTDAVLLAASAPAGVEGLIVDVGAGAGAVGLGAALASPAAELALVEIDSALASLAGRNLAAAGRAAGGRAVRADVLVPAARRAAGLADGAAALVLTNPPFHPSGAVRPSPDAARARAHVLPPAGDGDGLAAWVRACLALLAPGGAFRMIHRADALASCLAAIGGRLGGVAVLPVHSRADAAAIRVLIGGVKGSRAPLSLLPPLILHEASGAFAEQTGSIAAGARRIDMTPLTLR